ncbi:MAG TPA: DEAD/DEAH box helicase [Mycobacteriales bacterium]|nr:DEAD/DEAH box helicase [Mycobacteriales bacterium]
MHVVHASWHDSLLWVWVLADGAPADLPAVLDATPPVVAGEARVGGALRRAAYVALWLPTEGGLRRTEVPAVALGPAAAVSLLTRPVAVDEPAAAGSSLVFARAAARAALDLVAAGRVLPALRADGTYARATWAPAPTADGDQVIAAIADAMPPPFRSADGVMAQEPRDVLDDVLASLVDELARTALTGHRTERPGGSPVVWRWLEALGDPDGTTAVLPTTYAVAAEISAWWQSSAPGHERALLALRISEEPVDDESSDQESSDVESAEDTAEPGTIAPAALPQPKWRVEAGLIDAAAPEVYFPAAEVRAATGALRLRRGPVPEPRALLDATLGAAARAWPELAGLHGTHARPAVILDAPTLAEGLRHHGPRLERLGVVVQAPRWMREPARLAARLTVSSADEHPRPTGAFGMPALVDYRWDVTLDGGDLTRAELALLATSSGPFTQVRGQWVSLSARDRAAAATVLERPADRRGVSVVDALYAALTAGDELADLPFDGVAATGWVAALLTGDVDLSVEPVDPPLGFAGVLRPYQLRGLAWLVFLERLSLGACLADDMGLGKTIQLLALLAAERETPDLKPGPTLLVCPMSVVGNWQHESARFTPGLRVYLHHGPARLDTDDLAERDDIDLVVTSYGVLARDVEQLAAREWWRVVLDEAQAVKNPTTAQAQAVRRLRAARRAALTGTPIENRLAELHSIMRFLNPGLLGTAASFQRRFALPIERSGDEAARDALRTLTKPFVLRRRKTDPGILDELPPKQEMKVYCNLTKEQAALYRTIVDRLLTGVDRTAGMARRGMVLATLTKLKQVCNHPAHLLGDGSPLAGRSGKLAVLEEVLEEALAIDEKVVVFTQYAQLAHLLAPYLSEHLGAEVAVFHGGLSRTARDALRARFDDPAGPPVLIASLRAGGVGINLTAANHVVHLDRWWNPAVEQQATDRTHRIGQTKVVQVRTLICTGTLEERIDALLEQKTALAETIVGTDEAWLTELSTRDLRELLTLSADAASDA